MAQQESYPAFAQPVAPQPSTKEKAPDFSGQISNFASRLRLLEERYSLVQRRAQLIDKNMLQHAKELHGEIKTINADMAEIKKEINELNEKSKLIIRELQNLAPRDEVEILKKYIGYWEPLNFVTRNEVTKIIEEILEQRQEDKKTD